MGPSSVGASIADTALYQGRRPLGVGRVDTAAIARARPVSASKDQLLPLTSSLTPLFVAGGLRRGAVVVVHDGGHGGGPGGTTLAFALLAAASTASWCAAVGTADPGVTALAELGVDLSHLMLVPDPGAHWARVAATLLDGVDLVLVRPPGPVRPGTARRLAARTRERRAVLVVLAREWPEGPDVRLTVEGGRWEGIEAGHGHLRRRRAAVTSTGRRAATRPIRVALWLPSPSGEVERVEHAHPQ
jgi:hypothetical protein